MGLPGLFVTVETGVTVRAGGLRRDLLARRRLAVEMFQHLPVVAHQVGV
jgi:hypothetical protein